VFLYQKRLEKVTFLLTDDAPQYIRLLEVKTVRGIGQQMSANFRTLIKFSMKSGEKCKDL